jgi:hypothetical protein
MTKIYYESDADLSVLDRAVTRVSRWTSSPGRRLQGPRRCLRLHAPRDRGGERVRRDLHPHPRRHHPRAAHHERALRDSDEAAAEADALADTATTAPAKPACSAVLAVAAMVQAILRGSAGAEKLQ